MSFIARCSYALLALVALQPITFSQVARNRHQPGSPPEGSPQSLPARFTLSHLPLTFEPNRGQAERQAVYVARAGRVTGEFRSDGVDLVLARDKQSRGRVGVRFLASSSDPSISAEIPSAGRVNYMLGDDPSRWIHSVPTFGRVRYSELYPKVDLLFYGNGGALEHDFVIGPGGDPSQIAFKIKGAKHLQTEADGSLAIQLPTGRLELHQPHAYQRINEKQRPVPARFDVARDGTVRFKIGAYNSKWALIIDPVLTFTTYLDSTADLVNGVATDTSGNTYVTGLTSSPNFPTTPGSFQSSCSSCASAVFVTKLNPTGTAQVYSTFLGGSSSSQPSGIAVDGNGNAVVTGYTWSSDFPVKNPVAAVSHNVGDYYGFIASLSADGSALNYSSILGGGYTVSNAVAVDATGNAYITGITDSPLFPVTAGALQTVSAQYPESVVFVSKFNTAGGLGYSALVGDSAPQDGGAGLIGSEAIAVDSNGSAYITGGSGTIYPTTAGSYLPQVPSTTFRDFFVSKIHPDGSKLDYSTFLGQGGGTSVALDSSKNVWVVGQADNSTFPTTTGAYSTSSSSNVFAQLSADGSTLMYASFFGSPITQIALDANENIWLSGNTSGSGFPLLNPIVGVLPPNPNSASSTTSYLTEFNPPATTILFSTFLGDVSGAGVQIAADATGKIHLAGTTGAPIYTTPNAFLGSVPQSNAEYYPYAAVVDPSQNGATLCILEGNPLSFSYQPLNEASTENVELKNCGNANLTIQSISSSNPVFTVPAAENTCTQSLTSGATCTLQVAFTPTAVQTYSGTLTFASNASIPTTSIAVTGSGAVPIASVNLNPTFYPLLVGQTSPAGIALILNTGQVPLAINTAGVSITGDFALVPGGSCGPSLGPYQECSFEITFTPTAAGTRTGTLTVPTNDPNNPTLSVSLSGTAYTAYPIPTVTYVSSPTNPVNSGIIQNVEVFGTNFFPQSVIYLNGVAQTTSFQNPTYLTFSLDTSALSVQTTSPLTVANPGPGGGTSAPVPLTGYLSLPISAVALAYDSVGGMIYAAIGSNASTNPNTVIPIDPATGNVGTPIVVASGPNRLLSSGDGSYLYVGSSASLQRINLKTQAVERTFALPTSEFGQTSIQDMQVVPGSPQSVVTALMWPADPQEAGVALFNDSGMVNYLGGSTGVKYPSVDWISFAGSASQVYGIPDAGTFFTTFQVSPSGVSYTPSTASGSQSGPTGELLRSDGTNLYTDTGQVWSPSSQTLIGSFLEANGSSLFYTPSVVPDAVDGKTYFLDTDGTYYEFQSLGINAYSTSTYALLGVLSFPNLNSSDANDLLRWGANGFAFRIYDYTNTNHSNDQIVILESPLAGGASSFPVPVLSSIAPTSVLMGSADTTLTLIGSGFTANSVVQVNGSPVATTYTSSTQLTATVPAPDLASAGTLQINVVTPSPGGGTSGVISLAVNAPVPALNSISPSAVNAGAAATNVQLVGSGFTANSVAQVNGSSRPTTFVSASQLTTTLPPSDFASAGTLQITVLTPSPGGGISSVANLTVLAQTPAVNLTPSGLSFGNIAIGTSSAAQAISLTNSGNVPLTLNSVSASGDFSAANACGATVASGASCTISVTFTPTAAGPRTGTLTVSSNASTSPETVSLAGVGVEPVTFGTGPGGSTTATVTSGTTATYDLTLTGASGFSGSVTTACSGAPQYATCTVSPSTVSLASGSSTSFTVTVSTSTQTASMERGTTLLLSGTGLVAFFTVPFALRRRRRLLLVGGLIALTWVAALSGCGGGGGNSGGGSGQTINKTPAGTYTLTITATAGAAVESQNLTLVVQ